MTLNGRLADPQMSLGTDPRADPRMVAALQPFGLDAHPPPPPVTRTSSLEQLLEFSVAVEAGFQAIFDALSQTLPPVAGVTSDTTTIAGTDGNEISLSIHRPAAVDGPLPCVVHLHGGGMVVLQAADPAYVAWRDALAASGLVVVGVEFRNGAGKLGPHPYPAGLQDCADAVRWAAAHLQDLGASHVVISGESGGGNLALTAVHKAKREGWLEEIAGVYAQCPYISNAWHDPPAELTSMRENDNYLLSCELFGVLARVYDPAYEHADDATCWAFNASDDDLQGLPPHVISVNELDPLRDEGLAYYRRLAGAGVSAIGRVVAGTCHGGDVLLGGAMPDVYAASVRDVSGFARSLVP